MEKRFYSNDELWTFYNDSPKEWEKLTKLDLRGVAVMEFPPLPETLEQLKCEENSLSKLPYLPFALKYIEGTEDDVFKYQYTAFDASDLEKIREWQKEHKKQEQTITDIMTINIDRDKLTAKAANLQITKPKLTTKRPKL